jgi:exosortase/archaeosortase family protein
MISRLILSKLSSIPREVRRFGIKALILFVFWQLLYGLYLYPSRILDDALTQLTGAATESMLKVLYAEKRFYTEFSLTKSVIHGGVSVFEGSSLVCMEAQPLIRIADPCNGLNMYALFVGFILAYPASKALKMAFGVFGFFGLVGLNVARCVALAVLQIHHPEYTFFAHHYIFNVLTYAAVFGLWYWFTKKAAA